MKSVFLVVPNLRLGGQEKVAVETAKLLKNDFRVTTVIFDQEEAAYTVEGELINLHVPAKPSKIAKIFNIIKRVRKLKKLRKERKADICYSFGESANIVNVLSRGRGKTVTSVHGYIDLKNRGMDRFLYKRSDVVILCAKEIEEAYRTFFPTLKNAVTVHNPYDLKKMCELAEEEVGDFPPFSKVIVSHGRLEEVKNFKRLIRAFSMVKKEVEDVSLLLIGEGSEREALLQYAKELGVGESVFLPGFRGNPFSYLKRASVYVLSSYNEGFPNGLAEGMVFLPVIAADCKSGPSEMLGADRKAHVYPLHAKYGILVSNEDREATEEEKKEAAACLAKAITTLFRDRVLSMDYKEAARKRVGDFSHQAYKEKLIKLFESK